MLQYIQMCTRTVCTDWQYCSQNIFIAHGIFFASSTRCTRWQQGSNLMLYSLNFPFDKGGILDPAKILNTASILQPHKECSNLITQRSHSLVKLTVHYHIHYEPIRSHLIPDLNITQPLLYDLMQDVLLIINLVAAM